MYLTLNTQLRIRLNFIKYIIISFFITGCDKELNSANNNDSQNYVFDEELIVLDQDGNVIETTIDINHFAPSQDCQACHQEHYNEWQNSMHSHSFIDPIFMSLWNHEKEHRPNTGEKYCIQCHAPSAFVSSFDLSSISSLSDASNLDNAIKDGVSCQFCHNMVNTSTDVYTTDNVAAVAEYHISVDHEVMFGSIENPEPNSYHESYYSDIYDDSGICLPCHSQFIRGMPIEATFQEWASFDGFAMSDGASCQSCHMQLQPDGHHDHSFTGVDILDLSSPVDTSSDEYLRIMNLLETAVQLEFLGIQDTLSDSISAGEILNIPIKVKSFTGHRFPSGTTFTREAWLEINVIDALGNSIFSSGVLSNNYDNLNYEDEYLLFFSSTLIDQNGNEVLEASNAYDYIDNTLSTMGLRFHNYEINIPNNIEGPINISARMLLRPFKPDFLSYFNPELVVNIPVYEIANISKEIEIIR